MPQEWARPLVKQYPYVNKVLFKTFISEFNFRKDYFIAEWLENKGFNLLLECLLDPSHQLSLESNLNRFIRGKSVIELFNDSVKS